MENLMELVYGAAGEDEAPLFEPCEPHRKKLIALEELGFLTLAKNQLAEISRKEKLAAAIRSGYTRIPEVNIKAFLNRKVDLYDRQFAHEPKLTEWQIIGANLEYFSRRTGALNLTFDDRFRLGFSETGVAVSLNMVSGQRRAQNKVNQVGENSIVISSNQTCHFYKNEGIGRFVWTEIPISHYQGIPPRHALEALKAAQDKAIFDYFTIASVNAVQDPLLLGRIDDETGRFFIAQWDADVCLDDLI